MNNIFTLALVFVPIILGICWLGCNLVLKFAGMVDDSPFMTETYRSTFGLFAVFTAALFGAMALSTMFTAYSWDEYLLSCMGGSIGMGMLVFEAFAVRNMSGKRQKF